MQSACECSVGPRRAEERDTLAGSAGVFRECAAISIWTAVWKLVWNAMSFFPLPCKASRSSKRPNVKFVETRHLKRQHFGKCVWFAKLRTDLYFKSCLTIRPCVFYTKPKPTIPYFYLLTQEVIAKQQYNFTKFVAGVGRKSKRLFIIKIQFLAVYFSSRIPAVQPHTVRLCKKCPRSPENSIQLKTILCCVFHKLTIAQQEGGHRAVLGCSTHTWVAVMSQRAYF